MSSHTGRGPEKECFRRVWTVLGGPFFFRKIRTCQQGSSGIHHASQVTNCLTKAARPVTWKLRLPNWRVTEHMVVLLRLVWCEVQGSKCLGVHSSHWHYAHPQDLKVLLVTYKSARWSVQATFPPNKRYSCPYLVWSVAVILVKRSI